MTIVVCVRSSGTGCMQYCQSKFLVNMFFGMDQKWSTNLKMTTFVLTAVRQWQHDSMWDQYLDSKVFKVTNVDKDK